MSETLKKEKIKDKKENTNNNNNKIKPKSSKKLIIEKNSNEFKNLKKKRKYSKNNLIKIDSFSSESLEEFDLNINENTKIQKTIHLNFISPCERTLKLNNLNDMKKGNSIKKNKNTQNFLKENQDYNFLENKYLNIKSPYKKNKLFEEVEYNKEKNNLILCNKCKNFFDEKNVAMHSLLCKKSLCTYFLIKRIFLSKFLEFLIII